MPITFEYDGKPVPMELTLHESSGPVSPKYFFTLAVRLTIEDARVFIHIHRRGKPSYELRKELPMDRYAALMNDLAVCDVFARGGDFIGDEKRGRVGVSFNHFELSLGDRSVRIDYLLSQLGDPTFAPQKAIVDRMKKLADEIAPAASGVSLGT